MISSRHLDALLHPRPLDLHRVLLKRLVPVWLLLSMVAVAVAWRLESQQIDQLVHNLASDAITQFRQDSGDALWHLPPAAAQQRLALQIRRTPFTGVRLFDARTQPLAASWREPVDGLASTPAVFPPPGSAPQTLALRQDERIYVAALLPVVNQSGQLQGYFQGIYQVPPETARSIAHRLRDTLIGVLLVVAACALTLYPVILALHRNALRLSHNLFDSNVQLLRVLGNAIAKRDADTDSHNYRVTLYAVALAEAMQRPAREIIALTTGAFLHDVGKIGIADRILLKPGKLDQAEFEQMKRHVDIGLQIIREVKWLELAQDVVAGHHERYDGRGYPRGLQGEAIPYGARLFAIVDVFDALTSARPYKTAWPVEEALACMRQERGGHFDPPLLDGFIRLAPALHARYHAADTAQLKHRLATVMAKYFRQAMPEATAPD